MCRLLENNQPQKHMGKKDPRITDYIKNAKAFAQPVLTHLRNLVHEVVPEIEEKVKWGMPAFDYKGTMCSMASFKEHCSFSFWKGSLMKDAELFKSNHREGGMGDLGKIKSMADLPNDKLMKKYLLEARKLNDMNLKVSRKQQSATEEPAMHPEFEKQLKKNKAAFEFFKSAAPSCRKEYNNWINEAKRDNTRDTRIATAINWLEEGKGRNWKYEMKK